MTQWIITIAILTVVLIYTIVKVVRMIKRPKGENDSICASCSSDCGACPFISKVNLPDNLGENP